MKISFSYLHKFNFIILLTLFLISNLIGQTEPVIGLHENVPKAILFTNARIMVSPGQLLENGQMLIRDDQIEAVGTNIKPPADVVLHDINGKIIYPGFIDLFSDYGLVNDITSENETKGAYHWHGAIHPEKNAALLLKSDPESAKILRGCGFTNVLTFPDEGIFRGTGALIQLADNKANECILKTNVAQAMSFTTGKSFKRDGVDAYPRSLMGSIALIRQTLLDAQWYKQAWEKFNRAPKGQKTPDTDIGLAALH